MVGDRQAAAGMNPMTEMEKIILKLYVTGPTLRSQRARENLQHILDRYLDASTEIEVIDVLERPDLAERDKILATPTLCKEAPPPARRVIGDLSGLDQVMLALEIRPQQNQHLGE